MLRPLQLVLKSVTSQQERVKEKAELATAVAGGDLSREVSVGEALQLDPALLKKDEMGVVLNAVVGMSQAQVTLDRAFAAMTVSLRNSRDEDARRDRLKNGLFELNHILRSEHNLSELADRSLAFMATFLGAGAGVIYQYDDREGMLYTLSTYAVARSRRLDDGFRLGEGLAGQVALEQKMRCLQTIPANYLPISSALGEAEPLAVAILPIMHNTTLVGVLELGSFKQFTAENFEFLQLSLEGIAIAINISRSRLQAAGIYRPSDHVAMESA
jgi:transcriptional regulator with GAF, ATPase, and Fis domain